MTEKIKKIKQQLSILTHHPLYIKYSLFVIPSVCSLLALLVIFLVTVPQVFKLIEKNQELEQIKQKHQEYRSKAATLDKIDLDYYKSGLNDVLYILPGEKEIPSAINSILDILSTSGLQLTNFSLGASLPGQNNTESFGVRVDVSGNLEQIKNLINASEKSTRLLKIYGISLTNSGKTHLQASIDILVFYSPLDANTKISPDQKISPLSDTEDQLLSQVKQNIDSRNIIPNDSTQNSPTGKDDPFN